jgi:hypothetical protein
VQVTARRLKASSAQIIRDLRCQPAACVHGCFFFLMAVHGCFSGTKIKESFIKNLEEQREFSGILLLPWLTWVLHEIMAY